MEIRHSFHPDHVKKMDTAELRKHFLVENLFEKGKIVMVYSHIDRIITGSAVPTGSALELTASKELGVDYFMQRREMGIINVGAKGTVIVDGNDYVLDKRDGLYIGMGAKEVKFTSADKGNPAKFYINSTPAHQTYPTKIVTLKDSKQVNLGSPAKSNVRVINQYIHPAVLQSCQLVMGYTQLEANNMWNTFPCHTHDRRMEVYLYLDIPEDSLVFHFMGEPTETRHIVMRNEQAVISPSWSIHSGVGTNCYSFIWGMAGENQTFTDMDDVAIVTMK
jgi:4-deoxy-L-threo-5-hexosulose-uronate ketol-isomerase